MGTAPILKHDVMHCQERRVLHEDHVLNITVYTANLMFKQIPIGVGGKL